MIFAALTLLAALALASVAGWFSIVGLMAIFAGHPIAALILGSTLEIGKLVTTSWLYRNWKEAKWTLKGPLIYFTFTLMMATSISVFGFLSKAHLEQNASTIDNSDKISRLEQQIIREKSLIADNDKVIAQLDDTVGSFLNKDRTDKALSVRKSQLAQRKQLKDDSDAAQKRIESINDEKFKLNSELRKLQLEVGPIRYIAELFYGAENSSNKTMESAVRMFTLIIVSTLDPLAITLLIAANFTLLKIQNNKQDISNEVKNNVEEEKLEKYNDKEFPYIHMDDNVDMEDNQKKEINEEDLNLSLKMFLQKNNHDKRPVTSNIMKDIDIPTLKPDISYIDNAATPEVIPEIVPWAHQANVFRELVGDAHFIPQNLDKKENKIKINSNDILDKKENTTDYPKTMSWLTEFRRE